MSLHNYLSDSILLPVSDRITGWGVKKSLSFLQESQWWSQEELRNYQTRKLQDLISHCYNYVPFYKNIFDERCLKPKDIQTIQDLKKLPILSKEDIIENFTNGSINAVKIKANEKILRKSSGSTGLKTVFYTAKNAYGFNLACHLRGWYWMGYRLGDKTIKVSQNKRHSVIKRFQDLLDNTKLFTEGYDEISFEIFRDILKSFKPEYLRSYPDPLLFIASYIKKNNIHIESGLKGINTTGNTLFPEVRETIEGIFKTKIFDAYSCEGGPNFFECPSHTCYHSSMEYGISEILNSDNEEVKPGEQGRLITTDLQNYATPFIRYDSKDIVVKSENMCTCGRALLNIDKVIGRENDIILAPNGKYFIGQSFTTYFKNIKEIEYFQIYQESKNEFVLKFKVVSGFDSKLENNIIKDWSNLFGTGSKVVIELLEDIPLLPSGKRRFLVRNPAITLNF